jgi:phosphatidylinositol alpha-1,6-mannosyltransferase
MAPQDYATDEEVRDFNRHQPFPIIRFSSGGGWLRESLSRGRLLYRQIRARQPDLLLASGRSAVFLAAFAKRGFRLRLVAIGHGTEFGSRDFAYRSLMRLAYRQADAMIFVSRFTGELVRDMGLQPKIQAVIHNGADPEKFDVLSEDHKNVCLCKQAPGARHILLTVGSVTERKGQEVVVRALPEILKEFPDTHYVMAGMPLERQKLEAVAARLGVTDRIHFLGRVPEQDLAGILNSCDLFLMTSRFTANGDCEGFGIAAVEAAMCGKPAIVSGNSGLSEAILDGKTGFVVPQGDSGAAAQAVLRLLRDPGLRKAMGEAAYAYSRSQQTWERKGCEYDRVLRDLLTKESLESS